MRKAKHVRRELTDSERARVTEARRLVQQDETEIRELAKKYKQEYDAAHATLQEAMEARINSCLVPPLRSAPQATWA